MKRQESAVTILFRMFLFSQPSEQTLLKIMEKKGAKTSSSVIAEREMWWEILTPILGRIQIGSQIQFSPSEMEMQAMYRIYPERYRKVLRSVESDAASGKPTLQRQTLQQTQRDDWHKAPTPPQMKPPSEALKAARSEPPVTKLQLQPPPTQVQTQRNGWLNGTAHPPPLPTTAPPPSAPLPIVKAPPRNASWETPPPPSAPMTSRSPTIELHGEFDAILPKEDDDGRRATLVKAEIPKQLREILCGPSRSLPSFPLPPEATNDDIEVINDDDIIEIVETPPSKKGVAA